ncbi:hypothetical protein EDC19_1445 [Natranaerovirga hydrolytica]|uniref:Phosphatidylglycerol lysyltransferase n=1 Tax=Natranaerovirga hydrolytica TaxID=680378 RepID=A0A4R1MPL8_9FIRM|nr:lysylphosphatidylglycerol synthase transmembrane domain-containing protein [Natranaerovirga hydrolytica]TCK93254.1 hypothetical protein EDC19_1445 [Natranaerovirga hydrolytica]
MKKKWLLFLLGILAVVTLLIVSDLEKVWSGIVGIGLKNIIALCCMQLFTMLLINIQWTSISRYAGVKSSFKKIVDINLTGTFVESVTPAVKAGGELTKVIMFSNTYHITKGSATAIVSIQKVVSITAFLLLNIISLVMFIVSYSDTIHFSVVVFSFVFILIMTLLLIMTVFYNEKIKCLILKAPFIKNKEKVKEFFNHFNETIKKVMERKAFFIRQLLLSTLIWSFFPIKAYYIVLVMGINLHFITMAMITYITYMIGMLPLLPGGLGTFEGSLIMLLAPFSVAMDQGMVIAFVLRFVTFWFVFTTSAIYLGCKFIYKNIFKGNLQCN